MRRLLAALALATVVVGTFLAPSTANAKANLTTVSDIKVSYVQQFAVVATDNQPLPEYTPVVKIVNTVKKKTPVVIRDIKVERKRKAAAAAAERRRQQVIQSNKTRAVTTNYKSSVRSTYRSSGRTGKTSSYNWATPGQCTWGALIKWHQATGSYLGGFYGNALVWGYRAAAAGYSVGTTPRSRSILVMQPGVYGSSSAGHVAWVTSVSGNKVTVVEMNALAGPFNWNTRTLTHQGGMQYIYAP